MDTIHTWFCRAHRCERDAAKKHDGVDINDEVMDFVHWIVSGEIMFLEYNM